MDCTPGGGQHRQREAQGSSSTVVRGPIPFRPASEIHCRSEEFALHVLFVCTGNICRSPIAERLASAYSTRIRVPDFRASSAGTRAVTAHPIHPDAALVLEKLGGDASNFAARQLTSRIASDADLVLTMTRAHRDTVLELAPRQLHRTFTLSEAARLASDCNARNIADLAALRPHLATHELADIPDPIGRAADFFATVGSQIAELLPPIVELCQRSSPLAAD
ncbi:low molecular weight phosphatase family protein [Mycobacterium sp.]|uniref:arsenate reductase/protein-tyrosine-phosphatase family protein n=1 Tax=Mycobacterium sp. TaxID=1785 RepID=UPI002BA5FC95|nr:low molecular weight phosphatase family protein [Mycobacterium sp.]HKP39548.1 low molecular weight phosphatase family protein [Mycobacterium sp.]